MSTVLWANLRRRGVVESDTHDKIALYKHARRLEALARQLGLPSFEALCDTTDYRVNLELLALPEGMSSSDELMARDGVWRPAGEVVVMLSGLLQEIRRRHIRFGWFRNQHDEVVAELEESLMLAQAAAADGADFNFSVVM